MYAYSPLYSPIYSLYIFDILHIYMYMIRYIYLCEDKDLEADPTGGFSGRGLPRGSKSSKLSTKSRF